jgi:membrane fusion protein (multidrug efflux system)
MRTGLEMLAVAGAAAFFVLASCERPEPARPAAASSAPRAVRVARAELRPMERTLQVVGTLSPHEEATVAAQVAGQIERSYVDVGDATRAGQKMALIDTASYQALVRQASANVARATARAENVRQTLARVQQLQRDRVASASELDQAMADAAQARAEVQAAEAAAAIARLNLERSQVKAPFDGAVAQRIASAGDYVAIGTPMFRLVKTDPLRLRLQVPERESPAVRVGQSVRISVEGDRDAHTGRIARIAPAIREADRVLEVEADVPNRGGLRGGLFVRAHIVVDDKGQGLSVPAGALVNFAGLEKVVLVKDGKAIEKTVVTGRRGDGWIEIVSGLKAGDTVALDTAGLRTGQPVRPTLAVTGPPVQPAAGRLTSQDQ